MPRHSPRSCPTSRPLDFTDDAAIHYAEIRADLKKRGAMIGANDLFIAAHARALGLTLVTNNTAEFERVSGLAIENWTLPARRKVAALCQEGRVPTLTLTSTETTPC